MSKLKIGFIGLGKMGKGIAQNLAKTSIDLMVFTTKEHKLREFNAICKTTNNLKEIFGHSEIVFLCLPGSPEVEEIVNQLIEYGVKDKTIIDLSTSYPPSSIKLFKEVRDKGGQFFDASLSGGPQNALEGTLNVMVGGEEGKFQSIKTIFEAFAKNVFFVGSPGSGNMIKLANNYLSIMYVVLYAELIPLLKKYEVDLESFYNIVSVSGANCRMFESNARKMIDEKFDIAFEMKLALKDLSYIKKTFEEHESSSHLLNAGYNMLNIAEELGVLEQDISALVNVTNQLMKSQKPSQN